ncbi:hypothetical protein ATE48_07020 [Candidatus Viadribacter manganicus]|uniref:Peptidase C51 domain-containing protein n=2 Tax=Candidatus Viadribacter manganicus TaxID=1759059 RepID=A0A1B1AGK9_9PROT|nr:hypothetical protein ATE48_07020 [Candidatus Viadribacter manganicus]
MFAASAKAQSDDTFDEDQRGDPDIAYETVRVDPEKVAALSSNQVRATFNPANADFATSLLATADRFVGVSRANNENQVIAFLDLFDLPFRDNRGEFVPYCATGLAYTAALAYYEFWNVGQTTTNVMTIRQSLPELMRYHFYPSPSVIDMYYTARGMRRWRDASNADARPTPKPGWLVVYSFGREADHVGIVESADATTLNTIEFNTTNGLSGSQRNGGMVARRTRPYGQNVKGFIATDARRLP